MTAEQQTTPPSDWQAALDPQLTQRLTRPLVRPGVLDQGFAATVQRRAVQLISRSPLLDELTDRHGSIEAQPGAQPPIVLAQPLPRAPAPLVASVPPARELPQVSAQRLPPIAQPAAPSTPIARSVAPDSLPLPAPPAVAPGRIGATLARAPETPPVTPIAPMIVRGSATAVTPSSRATVARASEAPATPAPARPVVAAWSPAMERSPAPDAPAVPVVHQTAPSSPSVQRAVVQPLTPGAGAATGAPAATGAARPSVAVVQRAVEPSSERPLSSIVQRAAVAPLSSAPLSQPAAALPVVIARSAAGESGSLISRAIEDGIDGETAPDSPPSSAGSLGGPAAPSEAPAIDTEALVDSVLRKLSRQLAVEQERRGVQRWP